MKNGSSVLIYKGGATIALQRLHRILGNGYAGAFIQKPLGLIADPKIHHAAKCVFDAVAFFSFVSAGPCTESVDVIATLANVSRRQAIPAIQSLVAGGYLVRTKHGPREADSLTVVGPVSGALPHPLEAKVAKPKRMCRCGKVRSLSKLGICYQCSRIESQTRLYREAQAELPEGASHEEVAARVALNRESRKLLPVGRKLKVA